MKLISILIKMTTARVVKAVINAITMEKLMTMEEFLKEVNAKHVKKMNTLTLLNFNASLVRVRMIPDV